MARIGLVATLAVAVACSFDRGGVGPTDAPSELALPEIGARESGALDSDGPLTDLVVAPDALAPGDARLLFGAAGGLRSWIWRAAGGDLEERPTVLAVDVEWVLGRAAQPGILAIKGLVQASGQRAIQVMTHDTASWNAELALATAPALVPHRDFGLAVEAQSGDALLVYGDNEGKLLTWQRVGGNWGSSALVPLDAGQGAVFSGKVRWVELAPRPASDEIVVLVADDKGTLAGLLWDGAGWRAQQQLTKKLRRNGATKEVDSRAFDSAWELQSGDLLVAWGRDDGGGIGFVERAGGAWSSAQSLSIPAGKVDFVALSSQAASNRLAAAFLVQGASERLGLGIWTGSRWQSAKEVTTAVHELNDSAKGDFTVAVAWVGDVAVCVYPGLAQGLLDWYRWDAAGSGSWELGMAQTIASKGYTESVVAAGGSPGSPGGLLVMLSDDQGALYAARTDGTVWTLANQGQPLTTGVQRIDTVPFVVLRQ